MEQYKGEYIVELENICKSFPGVKALNNVNFSVETGEIHCLVGENGAGKSTLMKVLSGIHKYGSYEGDILLNGHTHVPAFCDKGDFFYMNPGSVSIPKEGSHHQYILMDGSTFTIKELDGTPLSTITLD